MKKRDYVRGSQEMAGKQQIATEVTGFVPIR